MKKSSFKPEIQHFVPGETRDPDSGKQTVPTLLLSFTGIASLKRAMSFFKCEMQNSLCMMILLMRYTSPSPSIPCAPVSNVKLGKWSKLLYSDRNHHSAEIQVDYSFTLSPFPTLKQDPCLHLVAKTVVIEKSKM